MTSDKKNISLLTDIFVKSGLTNIVISPGSRNAPIIISFANRKEISAFSIVDERSAAFFALGLALKTGKTVAIACTSGSAVLNYASAISEAYYQKIPLLVITADRPTHLIDIGDGQTIRQNNVFGNFILGSYQLPLNINTKEEYYSAEILINKALNNCLFPQRGPVHINVPFDEPIYNTTDEVISGKFIQVENKPVTYSDSQMHNFADVWNKSNKVMIMAGQANQNIELDSALKNISNKQNTIILTETTSNRKGEKFIDTVDNLVSTFNKNDAELFKPDLLVTFGGQVVSKMIKKFLRKNKPKIHWHISSSGEEMDTYFNLTNVIQIDETEFFNSIEQFLSPATGNYSEQWQKRKSEIDGRKVEYLGQIEYSDLKVFETILTQLPQNSVLHLGNSTPVRYSQLFGNREDINYNSNRGVSGIDGQVSTAVGYAYNSEKLNILITGDLGFLYDSNGLMNNYLSPNLRIIVINNSGGGIFRFIPGPDTTPNLEEFFTAKHNWKAEYICKAFDVNYLKAENIDEVSNMLGLLFKSKKSMPTVLEITTPFENNSKILREYFNFIKG